MESILSQKNKKHLRASLSWCWAHLLHSDRRILQKTQLAALLCSGSRCLLQVANIPGTDILRKGRASATNRNSGSNTWAEKRTQSSGTQGISRHEVWMRPGTNKWEEEDLFHWGGKAGFKQRTILCKDSTPRRSKSVSGVRLQGLTTSSQFLTYSIWLFCLASLMF